jgi:hypothetical protein
LDTFFVYWDQVNPVFNEEYPSPEEVEFRKTIELIGRPNWHGLEEWEEDYDYTRKQR